MKKSPISSDRLVIQQLGTGEIVNNFAFDVRAGLSSNPKYLLPKYFYDELGSCLFEAICRLPEYYVTRAEMEILQKYADDIIAEILTIVDGGNIRLIELGNGSSIKTRYFIEAILKYQKKLHYLPVDISYSSLEQSSATLLNDYLPLRITAYSSDYLQALQALNQPVAIRQESKDYNIVLFLGSSLGNLDPEDSIILLREMRKALRPGEILLLGVDLKKSPSILIPAYADSLGVTAAFNLNLLVRINRELGGNFQVPGFQHRAIYNDQEGRVEMHLLSKERQSFQIAALDWIVEMEKDETIHTENSYKYDMEQLSTLANDAGFSLTQSWFDDAHQFSLNKFLAV
jgi:L-histidine N-alpha-methyltransferase